jgi:uncharacterized membrane protein
VAEEDEPDGEPDARDAPDGSARVPDNSLGRLLSLSDGVFAIAMTLLALDLKVPNLSGTVTSQQLMHALAKNADSYWSFVLGFFVIATYWGAHRRLLRSVVVINQGLIRYTSYLLLIVAAMPFPTSLLGRYGGTPFTVALFGAVSGLATLVLIALTYEVRRCDPRGRKAITTADNQNLLTDWLNLAVFLLCIPGAYLLGDNGPYIFLLLLVTSRHTALRDLVTNPSATLRDLAHRYRLDRLWKRRGRQPNAR